MSYLKGVVALGIILAVVFSISKAEKECIEKKCSKFAIRAIGLCVLFFLFFLVWFFQQIGWIGGQGMLTGLED